MPKLIMLRHGQSTWNAENRFTGWVDVDLTPDGEKEARTSGELLAEEPGLTIDTLHTSVLTRAVHTADIALSAAQRSYIPVQRHWRLNERHYGELTGLNKKETADQFGAEQVKAWRRGYRTPPGPVSLDSPYHPLNDARYAFVPRSTLPATECLADVVDRIMPYYEDAIAPELLRGQTVLIVAHGNSLRALLKHLEGVSDDDIAEIDIPTGIPRLYDLDEKLDVREVRYLGDPDAALAASDAVKRQAG